MSSNLSSYKHSVGQSIYHFVWAPKYRYNMFRKDETARECEVVLTNIASQHKMKMFEVFVMPDHVHVLVGIPPTMSVSKALQLLKGGSSFQMFRLHPNFRKRYPKGKFWSAGKCFRSVGEADFETVKKYVKNQAERDTDSKDS
jgi:putative transposase